jgi:hypothetical protein
MPTQEIDDPEQRGLAACTRHLRRAIAGGQKDASIPAAGSVAGAAPGPIPASRGPARRWLERVQRQAEAAQRQR